MNGSGIRRGTRYVVRVIKDGEALARQTGLIDSRGRPVSQAATLDNPEHAVIVDPAPGTYTVELVNYAGGTEATDWTARVEFASPTPGVYSGLKEAWNLTCATRGGRVLGTREVIVDRGEVARIGDPCRRLPLAAKR